MARAERPKRRDLPTGAVARLFGVAVHTVARWADGGLLAGYRLPDPAGQPGDRRFRPADVRAFARRHGLPCPIGAGLAVVASGDDALVGAFAAAVPGVEVTRAASAAEAGWHAALLLPEWAVLDRLLLGAWDCRCAAESLARLLPGVKILVALGEDETPADAPPGALALPRPLDAGAVASILRGEGA